MKKWLLHPMWNLRKLEEKLEALEQTGWRLSAVRFGRLFCFEKAQPKNVRYFVTCNVPRERTMGDIHDTLLREAKSNVMAEFGWLTHFCVHRITDVTYDLQQAELVRRLCLPRCLWNVLFLRMAILLPLLILLGGKPIPGMLIFLVILVSLICHIIALRKVRS